MRFIIWEIEIIADVEYDDGEQEDIKISKDSEALLALKSLNGRVGYDPSDFVC